jgi:hypothetical protein
MKPISYFVGIILLLLSVKASSQKIMFLHHSTGAGVYSEGHVANWITDYNTSHATDYQMSEMFYPNEPYPWANYPYDYWNLWINGECNNSEANIACMDNLCANYDVIIFKHCFPGADIESDDEVSSVSSDHMTLGNYKLQYRALRDLMDSYPENKFIVWTLAPLHRLATNTENAARARTFVNWVKNDWLTEDGKDHPNIFVFDFYNYVAESNPTPANGKVNCLKYAYEGDHKNSDSHPNTLANQTVGPVFAQFIVDAIEGTPTKLDLNPAENPEISIEGRSIIIKMSSFCRGRKVEIYDLTGRKLLSEDAEDALYQINVPAIPLGIYIIKVVDYKKSWSCKLQLQ